MQARLLESLAEIAGIAGVAIGVFYLLARQIVAKNIFPRLNQSRGYRLLIFLLLAAFIIVIVAIASSTLAGREASNSAVFGQLIELQSQNRRLMEQNDQIFQKLNSYERRFAALEKATYERITLPQNALTADVRTMTREVAQPRPAKSDFRNLQDKHLVLTARKSDIDLRAGFIQRSRLALANEVNGLYVELSSEGNDADPAILERIRKLQEVDRQFEAHLAELNNQRTTVQHDLKEAERIISANIAATFKLMG